MEWLCGLKCYDRVFPAVEDARVEENVEFVDEIAFFDVFRHLKVFGCTSSGYDVVGAESDCDSVAEFCA